MSETNINLSEQLEKKLGDRFDKIIGSLSQKTGIDKDKLDRIFSKDGFIKGVSEIIAELQELTEYSRKNKRSASQRRRKLSTGQSRDNILFFLNKQYPEESLDEIAEYFLFVLVRKEKKVRESIDRELEEGEKSKLLTTMVVTAFGEKSDTLSTELQIIIMEYLALNDFEKIMEHLRLVLDLIENYPTLLASMIGVFVYLVGVISQIPTLELSQMPRALLVDMFTMFANNFGMGFEVKHLYPNSWTQLGAILAGIGSIFSVFPQSNKPIAAWVEDKLHRGRKLKGESGHIILIGDLGSEKTSDLVAKSENSVGNRVVSVTQEDPNDGSVWFKSDPRNITREDIEKLRPQNSQAICVRFGNDQETITKGNSILRLLELGDNSSIRIVLVLESSDEAEKQSLKGQGFELIIEKEIIDKEISEIQERGYEVIFGENDNGTIAQLLGKNRNPSDKIAVVLRDSDMSLPSDIKQIVIPDVLQTELFAHIFKINQPDS